MLKTRQDRIRKRFSTETTFTNNEKLKWAKQNIIPWMDIVKDQDGVLTIEDNERPYEEKFTMTHKAFIARIANYYNEELTATLDRLEDWIINEEDYQNHILGIKLEIVNTSPEKDKLLSKIKKEIDEY